MKINWVGRLILFCLIVTGGTMAALSLAETRGLALNDLSDASVSAITQTADNSVIFAALTGNTQGIFRSDDGGRSWQQVSTGPQAQISTLAVHPDQPEIMFAGARRQANNSGGNLWHSDDGGKNWDASFALPLDENGQAPDVSSIAALPNRPNLMYLGTWGQGLYRFDVREGQMTRLGGSELADLYVSQLTTTPHDLAYAATTEGLLKIRGTQVQVINTPDGVASVAVNPVDPNILYVGTVGYGLHRSTDGGQRWEAINNGLGLQPGLILRVPAIAIDSQNPQHLALTTAYGIGSRLVGDGLYESIDAGQSWQRVADLPEVVEQLTIEAGGIYAVTTEGLVRYGLPLPEPAVTVTQRLQSLTSPTAVQLAVLALTLVLGGWVLFSRYAWKPINAK